jgi:hypothetical protein
MAENIVSGLFGLSPYDVQQSRLQDTNAQALQYAKLDPFQKANMSLYQAGGGLGRMGAGMMGMVDPKEQEAQLAEMGQAQIDHSTPEGLLKGAEMFNQVGNPKMAMMYAQAAQAMKEKQSKLDLEAAHAKYYANGGSKGKTVQNLLAQLPSKQAIARQNAMQQGMAGNLSGKELTDFVNEQVRMTTATWLQTVKNINESSSTELNADGTTVQPLPIDYGSYLAEANPEAPTVQGKVDIAGEVKAAEVNAGVTPVMKNGKPSLERVGTSIGSVPVNASPEQAASMATATTKATKETEAQVTADTVLKQDKANAIKALETAGYNVKDGTDSVTKLLDNATGGYIGTGIDSAVRAFGSTTKGQANNASLKVIESSIVTDLLGGKLGAGISNTDRDYISLKVGRMGDSTLSIGERKAAWDEAKKRMIKVGLPIDNNAFSKTPIKTADDFIKAQK